MSRARRDSKVDTRSARLRLRPRKEPYWSTLAPGEALGYYRPSSGGDGTWWARVRFEDGHYRKRALGATDDSLDSDAHQVLSYKQAQAKAREWFDQARAEAGQDAPRTRKPCTVLEAWEYYRLDCIRRGVKRLDRMECGARLYILPELGMIEVERLTQSRIEKWHQAMSEAPPRVRARKLAAEPARGAAPVSEEQKRKRRASANRVLTVLKSALNHAKQKRHVLCSPDAWREVKPFGKADAPRVRYLKLEEQPRFVNSCQPEFRHLVRGALLTGARYGELARMQIEDFDAENGSVFIRPGKNGQGRHVYLDAQGKSFFQAAVAGSHAGSLIFMHEAFQDMRRVTPKAREAVPKVRRAWKPSDQKRYMLAACDACGIEPMGFHQLRHTYASTLVNAGMPLAYIAEMLGHSDTRMVEKHYGHLAPSAMKEALRRAFPALNITESMNVEALKIQHG